MLERVCVGSWLAAGPCAGESALNGRLNEQPFGNVVRLPRLVLNCPTAPGAHHGDHCVRGPGCKPASNSSPFAYCLEDSGD